MLLKFQAGPDCYATCVWLPSPPLRPNRNVCVFVCVCAAVVASFSELCTCVYKMAIEPCRLAGISPPPPPPTTTSATRSRPMALCTERARVRAKRMRRMFQMAGRQDTFAYMCMFMSQVKCTSYQHQGNHGQSVRRNAQLKRNAACPPQTRAYTTPTLVRTHSRQLLANVCV